MGDVHLRSACLYERGCSGCLAAGESTVDQAAAMFGVTVRRVLGVLHASLTDVYTPDGDGETDGLGGVIASIARPPKGSRAARGPAMVAVSTRAGMVRLPAGTLILASDSIAALHRYLGGRAGAR